MFSDFSLKPPAFMRPPEPSPLKKTSKRRSSALLEDDDDDVSNSGGSTSHKKKARRAPAKNKASGEVLIFYCFQLGCELHLLILYLFV